MENIKEMIAEYEKDAELILSYNANVLSKMQPEFAEPVYNDFINGTLKAAEDNDWAFATVEDRLLWKIAMDLHTIEYTKSSVRHWKGKSEAYICDYVVANGQPQLYVEQSSVRQALKRLRANLAAL